MSVTNKTSHSDDSYNDLPNQEKTYVKTCKNPVKIVVNTQRLAFLHSEKVNKKNRAFA